MPTARLIPSTYYLSNSNYLTVSNADNMYANTDSTSYATVQNTRSSTTAYYIYIRGFNFSAVPDDAIVSDISIKLKAYHSGGNTSTINCYDGTTSVAAAGSTTALTTSATVKTFTNTTIEWDTLKSYGSDFGIRINCRRSSRNTTAYFYIYGAEIDVTYTVPVYHNVSITGDTTPTGSQTVLEGDSLSIQYVGTARPTVTDNSVDVSSQLVESSSGSSVYVPNDSTTSNFTVTDISDAYTDAESDTYATLEMNGGGVTGTCYLDIPAVLPTGATLQSVSASVALRFNRNNSSSGFTSSVQMYTGSTAKGTATTWVSSATDVPRTEFTLSVGSWTVAELANARLYLTATNNSSSTHRFIYIYGVSLTVTYTISGKIYTYTLSNIIADHVIIFTAAANPPVITVGTPNVSIISAITGHDQCVCTFTSDLALQQWEARATKAGTTPARGVGLLVESGGSLAANTPATVYVENEELTNGDGEYTITVYGQSTGGVWSG